MKISVKKLALTLSLSMVSLIIFAFIILGLLNKKPVAAFYNISPENQKKIEQVLFSTIHRRNNKTPYKIVTLDSSRPLMDYIKWNKKPDIIFVYNGMNCELASSYAAKRRTWNDPSILSGMTMNIRDIALQHSGKITAIPLLIDNNEMLIHKDMFDKSGIAEIVSWEDVELLAGKTKFSVFSPICLAGAEDSSLIDFTGAMLESLAGIEAWNDVVANLQKQVDLNKTSENDYYELLQKLTAEDGSLFSVKNMLLKWQSKEILLPNAYQTINKDKTSFMQTDLTAVTFSTLSEHRTIPHNVISKYTSVYYPSIIPGGQRHFSAPVIMGISLSKNKNVMESLKKLASIKQDELSSASGLAPVQANSGVPDMQASDVRYWVAASSAPIPSLSNAAFLKDSQRHNFAQALRTVLKF